MPDRGLILSRKERFIRNLAQFQAANVDHLGPTVISLVIRPYLCVVWNLGRATRKCHLPKLSHMLTVHWAVQAFNYGFVRADAMADDPEDVGTN